MLVIEIGKKEYTIEFSIEASLCDECVSKLTNFLFAGTGRNDNANIIEAVLSTMTDMPSVALSLFYAGLLENHGKDGDGLVKTKADAKKLMKQYFIEHKEDGEGTYYSLFQLLLGQMGADGFFDLIGLNQMIESTQANAEKLAKEVEQLAVNTKTTTKTTKK